MIHKEYEIQGGAFADGGKVSTSIKSLLKELGIDAQKIRCIAIAAYEAEMNVIMYAKRGTMILDINEAVITITVLDDGPGIPDIELAMQEGYSTATDMMREMGFGAGLGLPNMKKSMDSLAINSIVGQGTKLMMSIATT